MSDYSDEERAAIVCAILEASACLGGPYGYTKRCSRSSRSATWGWICMRDQDHEGPHVGLLYFRDEQAWRMPSKHYTETTKRGRPVW